MIRKLPLAILLLVGTVASAQNEFEGLDLTDEKKPEKPAEPVKPAKSAATGTGPGKLTITSTPAALIYVDGRSTNQMTPKTLTLPPGSHKITLLEVTSRKAKTQEVDVPAGGSAQIAKKF